MWLHRRVHMFTFTHHMFQRIFNFLSPQFAALPPLSEGIFSSHPFACDALSLSRIVPVLHLAAQLGQVGSIYCDDRRDDPRSMANAL